MSKEKKQIIDPETDSIGRVDPRKEDSWRIVVELNQMHRDKHIQAPPELHQSTSDNPND